MEKFISKEKLSKKEKRRLNAEKRLSWGGISPVTKRVENKKAYNRKNARSRYYDDSPGVFFRLPINTRLHIFCFDLACATY